MIDLNWSLGTTPVIITLKTAVKLECICALMVLFQVVVSGALYKDMYLRDFHSMYTHTLNL